MRGNPDGEMGFLVMISAGANLQDVSAGADLQDMAAERIWAFLGDDDGWRRRTLAASERRENDQKNAKRHLIYGGVNSSFPIFRHGRLYLHCDLKYK